MKMKKEHEEKVGARVVVELSDEGNWRVNCGLYLGNLLKIGEFFYR